MKTRIVYVLSCLVITSFIMTSAAQEGAAEKAQATPISAQENTTESPQEKAARMQWFKDARLGIFIHWGIYAVNGIDESWSFYNGYISYCRSLEPL